MNNNDIIKRLRYILDVDDQALLDCFTLGGSTVAVEHFQRFLLSSGDAQFLPCCHKEFALFLQGLIIYQRGPSNKQHSLVDLTNNSILKKIRIALQLEANDISSVFMLADVEISPHEISALFRKPSNKHYTVCSDELLERFLSGLSLYYRR